MTEKEVARARVAGRAGADGAGVAGAGGNGTGANGAAATGAAANGADGDRSHDDVAPASRRRRRVTAVVAALCALAVVVVTIISVLLIGPRRPFTYGDWAPLDRLWTQCDEGDAAACDELFVESPGRSEYELFGMTCGNRFPGATLACESLMTPSPVDELGK